MLPMSPRPAVALLLLAAAACAQHALGALSATPSFAISAGATTPERSPALASQAFSKQWAISADADGQIAAIETLALDLPGQVFITYEKASTSSAKQIGSIKVFGATEAVVDAVSVASKRAMRGAKLAVSSANSPVRKPAASSNSSSADTATLLTEVVLLRKAALKKVITNGWADVVIADDVLFSKRKEDYAFRFSSDRALRATADNASSITLTEAQRQAVPWSKTMAMNRTWTIVTPTSGELTNVTLDVQLVGSSIMMLDRVDSDFLPEGAIATVTGMGGKAQVVTTRAAGGRDTLVVTPSNANMSVHVNLAANVELGSVTPRLNESRNVVNFPNSLNATFPDDAVSIFLNGSGNIFVLANNSDVYVRRSSFYVAGSGHLQVEIREMRAAEEHYVGKDFDARWVTPSDTKITGIAILDDMMCEWSPERYTASVSKETSEELDAKGKPVKCPVAAVPKKQGGSRSPSSSGKGSTGSPSSSSDSSKGSSGSPSPSLPKSAAAPRSRDGSLCGVALTIAAVSLAALS